MRPKIKQKKWKQQGEEKHRSIQLHYVVLACSLASQESMGESTEMRLQSSSTAQWREEMVNFRLPGDQKKTKKGLSRHIYTIGLNQII